MPTPLILGTARPLLPPQSLLAYDDLGRADSASSPGSADTGQVYAVVTNGSTAAYGIASRRAYLAAASGGNEAGAVLDVGCPTVDISTTCKAVSATTGKRNGLFVRYTDASNYFYVACDFGQQKCVIVRNLAGVRSSLGSPPSATLAADTDYLLRAVVTPTAIAVYLNGVFQFSVTDANLAAATKHGYGTNIANTGTGLLLGPLRILRRAA